MEEFLEEVTVPEIKTDDKILFNYVTQIYGFEIAGITKPCYYPKLIKYFTEIQNKSGVTDEHISIFKKSITPYYQKMYIFTEKYTILLFIIALHYSRINKSEIAKALFRFLALKFYASLVHKHFQKFCNPDLWVMSLDKISIKHLFKTKKGIANAVLYISDFEFEKNKRLLNKSNISDKEIISIIYMLRTKIAQSVRSFANMYYTSYKEKSIETSIKSNKEVEDASLISDKYATLITVYSQIDKEALSKSILNSGIRKEIAVQIITELSSPDHKDKLRFIFVLLSRIVDLKSLCMEEKRINVLRQISSNIRVANKYEIKEEIKNLLYSTHNGHKLRYISDSQLVMFFSNYITLFLQNRIC